MEKDPRARSGGLWSKRSNGFSAASVRGLYETQAHEETGGEGQIRANRIDGRGGS